MLAGVGAAHAQPADAGAPPPPAPSITASPGRAHLELAGVPSIVVPANRHESKEAIDPVI